MLLVETDGYTQHEVDWQMGVVIEALENNGAISVAKASTLEEAKSCGPPVRRFMASSPA